MEKIKIMIVDDQTLMRDGLKTILDLEDDMEVVGTAADGKIGYKMIGELRPDVVLMDIRMPNLNGVEATKLVKRDFPKTVIIILTTFDDDQYIIEALCHGASGYLLKDMNADKLIETIREGYKGNTILPSNIAAKLVSRLGQNSEVINKEDSNDYFDLTEREKEIGALISEGCSNKEIADKLYISIGTVKNYITTIYSKLGVNNRTTAALQLKKLGL